MRRNLTSPQLALPEFDRKSVGNIGPAGCAVAVTAAQFGHNETLYDAHAEIGGQFRMAKRIPGKVEFHETLRYLRTILHKSGGILELNTTMSRKDTESKNKCRQVDCSDRCESQKFGYRRR